MFQNRTSELVNQLLEDKYVELDDSIQREVNCIIAEQGRPVWTRVGIRVRNNEITVLVVHSKGKPTHCRSFSAGFVEHPWVLHA